MQAGGHRFEPVRLHQTLRVWCAAKGVCTATAEALASAKAANALLATLLVGLFSSQRRSEIDRLGIGFAPHTGAWLLFGCWHLAEAGCVFFITVNQVLVRLWARHSGHRPTFRRCSYLMHREVCWGIANSDRQAVRSGIGCLAIDDPCVQRRRVNWPV